MPKILNLAGAKAGTPLRVRNLSATEAEIVIYAAIGAPGFWDDPDSMISAKQVSDQLKALPATVNTLNIRINSPGGDVFDGVAIYNRLKQFKGKKIVHIDGLAASIASIIALSGDEIIMGEGALYMIHLPWTFAMGDRTDLDNTINRLMDVEEQMVSIYAKKTGMDRNEIKSLLEAETWMDSSETIDKGFADSVVEETSPIAARAIDSRWISKKPKAYFSEAQATKNKLEDLKKKVQAKIARK